MIALIIGFIVWVLIIIGVCLISDLWYVWDRVIGATIVGFISGIGIFLILFLLIIPSTSGLCPSYGMQEQVGYLTNFSYRGVIWKTWEGEIQKGVGEQTSVENHFSFSATDPDIVHQLKGYLGTSQRIKITCRQWICIPYSKGSTNKEVVEVEAIEDNAR